MVVSMTFRDSADSAPRRAHAPIPPGSTSSTPRSTSAGTPPKQKPRPARRNSFQDPEETARSSNILSPRDQQLVRRDAYHEAVAPDALRERVLSLQEAPPSPPSERPQVLSDGESGGGSLKTCRPPSISPLRLERLSIDREGIDATGSGASGVANGTCAGPHASWDADALPSAAGSSELTMALGSAPPSGIRSARFTPGRQVPWMTPGRQPHSTPRAAEPQLEPPAEETSGDDDEVSEMCGCLSVFVCRGPALPQGKGLLSGALPRSFFDACRPLTTAEGTPVAWPVGKPPPAHLIYFCFPGSVVERLCTDASDAFGFTFSFTSEDGSFRWGCAVTGVDPSNRDARNATSVVVLCDWPLVSMNLDLAKQLFLLEQRQRKGWRGLVPNVSSFARALAESRHEVDFLMHHPLWLPRPLSPLLEGCAYSADVLLLVFLAALLERPLLLHSSSVAKLMPTATALAHLLSPLSFSGTFIPFLPEALHPDPATLVNCSPAPFIIGVEQQTVQVLARLRQLTPTPMPTPTPPPMPSTHTPSPNT